MSVWRRRREDEGGADRPRASRRSFLRDCRAAITVEFGLLAIPFCLIVFMILETAFVFIGDITLEQAVAKASRTVRTGYVATSAQSEADFKRALCDQIPVLISCEGVRLDLRSYSSFDAIPAFAPVANGVLQTSDFRFERGNAGQIMALRVFYEYPLFTDIVHAFLSDLNGNKHLLMSVAVFQTEPF